MYVHKQKKAIVSLLKEERTSNPALQLIKCSGVARQVAQMRSAARDERPDVSMFHSSS